jgi:hypothetical protein
MKHRPSRGSYVERQRSTGHRSPRRHSPALCRKGIHARCFCINCRKSISAEPAPATKQQREESHRSPRRQSPALCRRAFMPDASARTCGNASPLKGLLQYIDHVSTRNQILQGRMRPNQIHCRTGNRGRWCRLPELRNSSLDTGYSEEPRYCRNWR